MHVRRHAASCQFCQYRNCLQTLDRKIFIQRQQIDFSTIMMKMFFLFFLSWTRAFVNLCGSAFTSVEENAEPQTDWDTCSNQEIMAVPNRITLLSL